MSNTSSNGEISVSIDFRVDGTGTFNVREPSLTARIFGVLNPEDITPFITISSQLPSIFFRNLIDEINNAYLHNLYTSTFICLRKLFENLLIELLRKRYGTTKIELYYIAAERRFQNFSILINNLTQNVGDFSQYTAEFNQSFFNFINALRIQSNASAHSIHIMGNSDELDKINALVNQYCMILCDVIRMIT